MWTIFSVATYLVGCHLATLSGSLSNPHPISEFENGVIVGSLAEAAQKIPAWWVSTATRLNDADDGLVARTALARDGVIIS